MNASAINQNGTQQYNQLLYAKQGGNMANYAGSQK